MLVVRAMAGPSPQGERAGKTGFVRCRRGMLQRFACTGMGQAEPKLDEIVGNSLIGGEGTPDGIVPSGVSGVDVH